MRVYAGILVSGALALCLSACGGGGDTNSTTASPSAQTLQITSSNYLDASAVAWLGEKRFSLIQELQAFGSDVKPGPETVMECGAGGVGRGSIRVSASDAGVTYVFNGCSFVGGPTFESGTLKVANAKVWVAPDALYAVATGDYSFVDVVFSGTESAGPLDAFSGSLKAVRSQDGTVTKNAEFSVLRGGKTDVYRAVTQKSIPNAFSSFDTYLSMEVDAARFGVKPLKVAKSEIAVALQREVEVLTMDSPSGAALKVTAVPDSLPKALKFELIPAGGVSAGASMIQTLAENDPQIQAAIERALK